MNDLQRVVDQTTTEERARLEALGLVTDGKVSPLVLSEADLTVDALWSPQARTQLLARPQGLFGKPS